MRKVLLPGIAAALVATAVPASAHPTYHYEGGCGFTTLSDGGEDDQTTWTGEADALVVATDAATGAFARAWISIECHVYKNGVYQGVVLQASGSGYAVGATQYVYQAAPEDVITFCDAVTVGSKSHYDCGDSSSPLVPGPVQDVIDAVFDELNAFPTTEPWICPFLGRRSGTYVPGGLVIAPEGDVYVAGEHLFDCPPYGV